VHHSLTAYVLGGTAAMLMGLAKTGLPGVSIPAVLLMVEAFPDDAKSSVAAIMPAILVGDVFAVAWFRRHADWSRLGIWLLRIIPQRPFDVLALSLAGAAAVRLIVA